MKIAVFGATGQTGLPILKQALSDSDIQLKACVRNPEKLKTQGFLYKRSFVGIIVTW